MKQNLINLFFYLLALSVTVVGLTALRVIPEGDSLHGIISICFLILYYGIITSIAKSKNRSVFVWFLAATFLTPLIGFIIIFVKKIESEMVEEKL